jgi:hypothetical protein
MNIKHLGNPSLAGTGITSLNQLEGLPMDTNTHVLL